MKQVFDDKRYTNEGVHTFLDNQGDLIMVYEYGVHPYKEGGFRNKEALIRTMGINRDVKRLVLKQGAMAEFLREVKTDPQLSQEFVEEVIY